ncbi:MAG: NAD(P)H-dependent oxidoreductase [Acidobacteria bacterium]|nr:NAD(P)H-dependent oxidoreductase [Acidobacteriota bacterium]
MHAPDESKALLVHAHHEPLSFCSALFRQTTRTLAELGYHVDVSDLYAMGWNPVSDRRNFSSVLNSSYLKQQTEEQHASKVNGFGPDIEAEIRKLEVCDLLIFSFPLWWYGLPAILKGWVDRVFAMGRVYGGGRMYENGLGKAQKRAMVIMTTGGGAASFGGYGMNLSLESVLKPIEHGIFWFNGFLPLEPFVAWHPARISQEERQTCLAQLDVRLQCLHRETHRQFPLRRDFVANGTDQKKRFMVVVTRKGPPDERYFARVRDEVRCLARLKREGFLLASHAGPRETESWKGFLVFREANLDQVKLHLSELPLAPFVEFEITELAQD